MNEERDRYLTEAMGKCWHRGTSFVQPDGSRRFGCSKCGSTEGRHLFKNWSSFGLLWEWATKQEWWNRVVYSGVTTLADTENGKERIIIGGVETVSCNLINPDHLANAIYKLIKTLNPGVKK